MSPSTVKVRRLTLVMVGSQTKLMRMSIRSESAQVETESAVTSYTS